MIETIVFYAESWGVYALLGLIFLFLLDLKLRKRAFALRAGLLSLVAVFAFTPETVSGTQGILAPKVVTSLLNAEAQGIATFYEGLITLAIIWGIVFSMALAIYHALRAKKKSNTAEETAEKSELDRTDQ